MALSGYARAKVRERDGGICALCGADCEFLERISWVIRRLGSRLAWDPDGLEAMRLLRDAWGFATWTHSWDVRSMWEADHVVPLAEGGTNDLENYRTLCIPCHREQTRLLAGRLAVARRGDNGRDNGVDKPVDNRERSG